MPWVAPESPAASKTSSVDSPPPRASNSEGTSPSATARARAVVVAPRAAQHPPPPPNCVDADEAAARASDESWSMPRNAKYESQFRSFMSFVHGRPPTDPYPKETLFTRNQLLALRPRHVCDWLSLKAFHRADWSHERRDRPIFCRSWTLEHSKRCVSYFMPDNVHKWFVDVHRKRVGGNPTKSDEVANLISIVKMYEGQGEGAPVRGEEEAKERGQRRAKTLPKKAKVRAQKRPNARKLALRAPHRANDEPLTLANGEFHDEVGDSSSDGTASNVVTGTKSDGEDLRSLLGRLERLERAQGALRAYIGEKFGALDNNVEVGQPGSDQGDRSSEPKESNEAGPAKEIKIAACGVRVEESAASDQGHRSSKQSESNEVGPAKGIKPATLSPMPRHLLTLWREYAFGLDGRKPAKDFTPDDKRRLTPAQQGNFSARNVIWQCMASQIRSGLSPEQAADRLYNVYGSEASVTKIRLSIAADRNRYWGSYHPDLLLDDDAHACVRHVEELLAGHEQGSDRGRRSSKRYKSNEAGPPGLIDSATLSPTPRDLLTLWREYTSGLNGRKPAKDFNRDDKRRLSKAKRQRFYRRNVIWKCMASQIESGLTPEQAAERIYGIYGSKTCVTKISQLIVADRSRYGGHYHPRLLIKGKARVDDQRFEKPSPRQCGSDQGLRS